MPSPNPTNSPVSPEVPWWMNPNVVNERVRTELHEEADELEAIEEKVRPIAIRAFHALAAEARSQEHWGGATPDEVSETLRTLSGAGRVNESMSRMIDDLEFGRHDHGMSEPDWLTPAMFLGALRDLEAGALTHLTYGLEADNPRRQEIDAGASAPLERVRAALVATRKGERRFGAPRPASLVAWYVKAARDAGVTDDEIAAVLEEEPEYARAFDGFRHKAA